MELQSCHSCTMQRKGLPQMPSAGRSCRILAPARPQDREQLAKAPLAASPQLRNFNHTHDRCSLRTYFKTCWKGAFPLLIRGGWGGLEELGQ